MGVRITMNVTLLIPPAMDWNMPLIALPLLKAYLPEDWNVKVIDINAKLFSTQFSSSYLATLKQSFSNAIIEKNLLSAVNAYLTIEESISSKQIGSASLQGRGLHIVDKWFDSNTVYAYLQDSHNLTSVLTGLLTSNIEIKDIDVFGISISVEEQIVPSFIICSVLRNRYPNAKIILGGNIVSRLYENILKSALEIYFDMLIIGEGEAVFQKAIELIMSNRIVNDKVYLSSEFKENSLFKSLRMPDFDDIYWDDYLSPINILPITVQRKCKWSRCDFCAIHACWTHGVRERNVVDVVGEIETLISKYNVRYFRIVDEMVCADYLYRLSSFLLKRNINIIYEAYVRFEEHFTNTEYVKTIFNSGCRQLFWGLENINDEALKFMNKGTDKLLIEKCLRVSSQIGITNYCFILMGIPQISKDAEKETIDYVNNNPNIHVGVVGSFVIDRLSPIHIEKNMHKKYGITIFDIGDLTTEVGYLHDGLDERPSNKLRTAGYIKELYSKRPDFAICSLLSEEARLVLTTTFGNQFAINYILSVSSDKIKELIEKSTARLIEERVVRRTEEG